MTKTIIVLSAPENTGKTTTLFELYNRLILNGTIVFPKKHKKLYNVSTYDNYTANNKTNKLGINTVGDSDFDIFDKVQPLIDADCDIIVTAARYETHSSFKAIIGKSNKWNLNYRNKEYNVVVTSHIWEHFDITVRKTISQTGGLSSHYNFNGVDFVDMSVNNIKSLIDALMI